MKVKISFFVLVIVLIFWGASFAQDGSYKDPFKFLLPVEVEEGEPSTIEEESMHDDSLPDLTLEGVIWEVAKPRAIIDGEIYKSGDKIKDIDAYVSAIDKGVVFISYGERTFKVKVSKKKEEE